MQNMYPGIPFSPNTILTRAINDTDTAIYVADSSVFPDGPNLATIGTDESAETILYAQKGDGVLSGCLRGIEGKAKSWRGNDLIARNFTAYDYEALRSNLSGHLEAENPHSVTPEMIQAAPERHTHLTPTFTAGHIPLIGTDGNFTDSGQALDDIDGPLNEHIANKDNPHGVTVEQIGAALKAHIHVPATFTAGHIPVLLQDGNFADSGKTMDDIGNASHTHSTDDITNGTLPVERGGTGATTAAVALTNLGGVPTTRTINNKALSSNISLNYSDVGAASSGHTHTSMLTGTYGTSDKTAGSSSLTTGTLYFMYT